MIKVNYDTEGKIMGFYPDTVKYADIPEPYIEIDEKIYKKIFPELSKFRILNGELEDISNTQDYIQEQTIYENSRAIYALKKEITEIENSQHRAIREYALAPCPDTKQRLEDIDNRICEIRTRLQNIQI